jgi:glycosyltransferase involved in cell wall biosynthesis
MTTDILFFVGGVISAATIGRFVWLHRRFFADAGLVTVAFPDALWPAGRKRDALPAIVTDPGFAPKSVNLLTELAEASAPRILLRQNCFAYREPLRLELESALCRRFFPQARQRALCVVGPADREIEALCAQSLRNGAPQVPPLHLRALVAAHPSLETTRERLAAIFGPEAVAIIQSAGEEADCRAFIEALLRDRPEAREQAAALPFTPHPAPLVPPRDVLEFMAGVNQLFATPGKPSPHPWHGFHAFLRGGARPVGRLLQPYQQDTLRRRFGALHVDTHPLPEAAPDDRRRLTDAEALRLARLLPPEHLARLVKGPHVAQRFQTRAARQCLRALRQAAAPGDVALQAPEKPRLVVLTATYNHAAYIAECIESVLAQRTSFPIRHIIADDGSNDGTRDIILQYAANYPHIVPLFQKTRSHGARNLYCLLDMADTEYVSVCEGDDYFTDPDKLQTQVAYLDAHADCALCFHVARMVFEDDPRRNRLFPQAENLPRGIRPFYYLGDLIKQNFIQTNTAVYRWRFPDGLPDWFRTDLCPGDWYWHLLHAEMGKIGFIDREMSAYRRHAKGIYYLAEIDKLAHRAKLGFAELEVYTVVNRHFQGKHLPTLLRLADSVFADCLLYDKRRAEERRAEERRAEAREAAGGDDRADAVDQTAPLRDDEHPTLDKLCAAYPEFAGHFLQSLSEASGVPSD